jgi:hypothetical protein
MFIESKVPLVEPQAPHEQSFHFACLRASRRKDINPQGSAPYHLINATVNLPSSESVVLRERKSDFFLFSKHWCGAPPVGYHKTDQWRANDAPVDLATAMAVSGAAASSYMGLGSMPTLTALLTFLNVRLGYWINAISRSCEWRSGQIPNTATGVGRGEDWRSLWISFR